MRKKIKLQVEVALDGSVEHRAMQIAREEFGEVGQATIPLDDKGERWRDVSVEELIPDVETAIMELIGVNDLLKQAGVEVTAVTCLAPQREEPGPQEENDVEEQEGRSMKDEEGGGREAELDEFETGVFLCRWPNGDFSIVTANTRREALVQLDEWAGAHPSFLVPLETCLVDFQLNDLGEIKLNEFGEVTDRIVWEQCYPELDRILSSPKMALSGSRQHDRDARNQIRRAVRHERTRLWKNQPDPLPSKTDAGRRLQKAM
ncbi:hypothetical protein SBA2_460031 [Acidobacteriia bacterium SbA2]|nr:hypothetical protein SBA2_460031 [Acidobacteriia bacterium SbA2]